MTATRTKTTAAITAGALAIATTMAANWEGLRTRSYQDVVGVWTICYGETKGVVPGQSASPADCKSQLSARLAQFGAEIAPCLPLGLPDKMQAAFIDVAYNIGSAAFCKSSMSRKARAGDLRGACDALLAWNKGRIAGVLQPIKGLTNRRNAERQACLEGLAGR